MSISVNSIRTMAVLWVFWMANGCSVLDFEMEQVSEEVVLKGDLSAFQAYVQVPADLIPAQNLSVGSSGTPNGLYAEEAVIALTNAVPTAFNMQIPFSFINSLEIWLYPESSTSSLKPLRLAWTGPTGPGHEVDLIVDRSTNLVPYLQEQVYIKNVLDARVPAADLSFQTRFVLGVDVL